MIYQQSQQQDTYTNGYQSQYNIPIPFLQEPSPLGDLVAAITKLFGAEQCTPCKARQEYLNRMIGFRPW